jgi:hypothetical protein
MHPDADPKVKRHLDVDGPGSCCSSNHQGVQCPATCKHGLRLQQHYLPGGAKFGHLGSVGLMSQIMELNGMLVGREVIWFINLDTTKSTKLCFLNQHLFSR